MYHGTGEIQSVLFPMFLVALWFIYSYMCMAIYYCILCIYWSIRYGHKKCFADLNESIATIDHELNSDDFVELNQRFSEIIQFHSNARELHSFNSISTHCDMIQKIAFCFRFIERFSQQIGLPLTGIFVLSSSLLCATLLTLDTVHVINIENLCHSTYLTIKFLL